MAEYPFLDPAERYYGAWARLTACAKYIHQSAAADIRAINGRWRGEIWSGYGGNNDGYTVRWILRNYPSLPVTDWEDSGFRIPVEPTLSAVVRLGLRGGYGIDPQEPYLDLPPSCDIETGEFEEQGQRYAVSLYMEIDFFRAATEGKDVLVAKTIPLDAPLSIDGLLVAVGVALEQADEEFEAALAQKGMTYSDPVYTPPETITISDADYQTLLRAQEDNEGSRAQVEEFRLWCQANKGVSTVEEGVRACTTAELLNWLAQQSWYIGYYLQYSVGQDLGRRVIDYEAAEAAAREAALTPITHINPWGGEDSG